LKRPWILTPKGQRSSMLLATLMALLGIPFAARAVAQELDRQPQPQDISQVDYCELASCKKISKLEGLEVLGIESIEEGKYGILIEIRLLNHGGLSGEREVWAELRSATGNRIESMRGVIQLSPKGKQLLELFFTGNLDELQSGKLLLGF
jgi:hypothetical protein